MEKPVRIEWHYEGKPDFSSGTGAYATEKALGWASAFVVPGFLAWLLATGRVEWTLAQSIVAFALAFDVSGGLVSNALNSCKRFYHSPPKPSEGRLGVVLKRPVLFSSFHVHPIVVWALFEEGRWTHGLLWYAALIASVLLVLAVPLYLRRPVSLLLVMLAILASVYIVPPVNGFEWLMPLLFLKIVYGHAVREEPYRKS